MAEPRRIGVIGAGILGLTAALRCVQAGARVTIIEREDRVGGLVASFEIGGSYLERFYHHLFRSDRDIQELIAEVGLGHDLVWPRPDVSSLYGGKLYGLDSALDVLLFPPLSIVDRLRLGAGAAYLKLENNYHRLEGQTAAAWIKRWMGPEVYRVVWGPLLHAKFGDLAEQIAMPWFWSRVHLRSQRLGYLRGGFFRLYARLAEVLEQKGARILLNTEVRTIRAEDGQVLVETANGVETFDRLLATTPTRIFMRLAEGLPDEYLASYDRGEYYGAHAVIVGLNRQLLDGTYWLNIHDSGFPFLTVVEHTNYMPPADYGGLHIIYMGNYLPMSNPLFRRPDEEVLAEFLTALRRVNPAFDESWVVESHVFKAPFYSRTAVSDAYDRQRFGGASGARVNAREIELALELVPSTGQVLDLACGTGRLSEALARRGQRVVGVDYSPPMAMRTAALGVPTLIADAFATPFASAAFASVVALRFAFHYVELGPLLAEMRRVTAPGGSVVFDTYTWSPRSVIAFGSGMWGGRVHLHSRQEVKQLAAELGLRVERSYPCFLFSPYLYRLVPLVLERTFESLERRVPASWLCRVFWKLGVP